jgi:hypothetical protein
MFPSSNGRKADFHSANAGSIPVGNSNLMSMSANGLGTLFFRQDNAGSSPVMLSKFMCMSSKWLGIWIFTPDNASSTLVMHASFNITAGGYGPGSTKPGVRRFDSFQWYQVLMPR